MAISQIVTNSIATGAVSAADLADGSVTNDKLSLSANASNIATALNATGSAPIYACRAWVNLNGNAATPVARASGNVSSITDNGTGDYTVNFTTAMPDANYAAVTSADGANVDNAGETQSSIQRGNTASALKVICTDLSGNKEDYYQLNIAVFR